MVDLTKVDVDFGIGHNLYCVSAVDFFNQINMLYGTITEFCTEKSCTIMSAGPKYEYHWADGHTVKKPIKCSAPKYIDYLMTWVQDQLDDETLFPSKIGVPFPKNFLSIAKTILKRLFRVYAHIYHQHFEEVVQLGEEAHLNTSFKHFIFFVQVFLIFPTKICILSIDSQPVLRIINYCF